MRTELELPTGIATIGPIPKGSSISIDGFNATARQLEVLGLIGAGVPRNEISLLLGVSLHAINMHLIGLKIRNLTEAKDISTVSSLAAEATRHEILFPISVIGIKAVADELRKPKPSSES